MYLVVFGNGESMFDVSIDKVIYSATKLCVHRSVVPSNVAGPDNENSIEFKTS